MSLFQCDLCGCVENTACSSMGHLGCHDYRDNDKHPAILSYREILGLSPEDALGQYCSACSPVWYDAEGNYGVGPNPAASNRRPSRNGGGGMWHGKFQRDFLPKWQFDTNRDGNLTHRATGNTNYMEYARPEEYEDANLADRDVVLRTRRKYLDIARDRMLAHDRQPITLELSSNPGARSRGMYVDAKKHNWNLDKKSQTWQCKGCRETEPNTVQGRTRITSEGFVGGARDACQGR